MPHPSSLPPFALFAPFEQLASLDMPHDHGSGHGSGQGPGHGLASVSNALILYVVSLALAPSL